MASARIGSTVGPAAPSRTEGPTTPVATTPASPAPSGWTPKPAAAAIAEPGFRTVDEGRAKWAATSGQLFVDGVSADDALQGSLGDCYAVSGFAALAAVDPTAISDAITDNHDGTCTVRFYKDSFLGLLTRGQQPTYVTVDTQMPTTDGSTPAYAHGRDPKELWPLVLEKAWAKFDGSYQSAGKGGSPVTVWQALTGRSGSMTLNATRGTGLFEQLQRTLAAGRPVAATTTLASSKATNGLVSQHVYAVLSVREEHGQQLVQLRNPWGHGEPGADGRNDGVFTLPFAEFKKHYGLTFFGG